MYIVVLPYRVVDSKDSTLFSYNRIILIKVNSCASYLTLTKNQIGCMRASLISRMHCFKYFFPSCVICIIPDFVN